MGLAALTTLSCRWLHMPAESLSVSLPHLQVINCCDFVSSYEDLVDSVGTVFPGLFSLRVRSREDISGRDAFDDGLWPEGQTLTKLVSLDVVDMSRRPLNMAGSCAAVKHLMLRDLSVRRANDAHAGLGLQVLGRRLRSLTVTNVRTDELLASVVLACPLLTDLCIGYTSVDGGLQVTDAGLGDAAGRAHGGLRRVTLQHCRGITGAGVGALAMQPLVESISVEGCPLFQWRDAQRVMEVEGRLGLDIRVC